MVGIYKITSPSGKVYIGQSVNITKRKKNYSTLSDCKNQRRLYSSLVKYGFSEHIFEVVEECNLEELNIRERYWQDFYNVTENRGLNCLLTHTADKSGYCSKETAAKIGESNRGKKKPPRTEAHRKNLSEALKGKSPSKEARKKMSDIRKSKTGPGSLKGKYHPQAREVVDTATGTIYPTQKSAADAIGVRPGTLRAWLAGQNVNKSTMIFK